MTRNDDEAARIRAEYARRDQQLRERYTLDQPSNLFIRQGQQRALRNALERGHALPLSGKRILEVGCGRGQWFGMLEDFGARRDHLAGIDLDASRLAEAKERYPGADLRVGDATALPWESGRFDLVLQSTVFTSILDVTVRRAVAKEMRRMVRTGGAILWYDFRYNNPANAAVRGIGEREIRELFPDCHVELESATLAPPLTRRLVPLSWLAASVLERARVLNTHYLGLIRPR